MAVPSDGHSTPSSDKGGWRVGPAARFLTAQRASWPHTLCTVIVGPYEVAFWHIPEVLKNAPKFHNWG
jgi:hypothetical protein